MPVQRWNLSLCELLNTQRPTLKGTTTTPWAITGLKCKDKNTRPKTSPLAAKSIFLLTGCLPARARCPAPTSATQHFAVHPGCRRPADHDLQCSKEDDRVVVHKSLMQSMNDDTTQLRMKTRKTTLVRAVHALVAVFDTFSSHVHSAQASATTAICDSRPRHSMKA